MNQDQKPSELEDDLFWRKLVMCEEDRRGLYPWMAPSIGFRWFRSPNVIPIEQARRRRARQTPTTSK